MESAKERIRKQISKVAPKMETDMSEENFNSLVNRKIYEMKEIQKLVKCYETGEDYVRGKFENNEIGDVNEINEVGETNVVNEISEDNETNETNEVNEISFLERERGFSPAGGYRFLDEDTFYLNHDHEYKFIFTLLSFMLIYTFMLTKNINAAIAILEPLAFILLSPNSWMIFIIFQLTAIIMWDTIRNGEFDLSSIVTYNFNN